MKNRFLKTLLGFTPYWDYKPTNAVPSDSSGKNTSDKIFNLITKSKTHLKCNVIDGSIVSGLRQPILFSFISDKPSGYILFCEPETIDYKKLKKSVLNSISFCLENDKHEEVNFNGETLTLTLQLLKIWTIKWASKVLK